MPNSDENREPSDGDDAGVTLINVFEMPADQVDKFMAGWKERADILSTKPGFRDYALHRALLPDSRFQLVNVAHWDSQEAIEAATTSPEFVSLREAAQGEIEFSVVANAALYRVVSSVIHT
jgi:heme-degrading monooxygenase HmoA